MPKLIMHLVLLSGFFVLTGTGYSASIEKCSKKDNSCAIKLEEGLVGDTVSVLNGRGQPVAVGWIVKREETTATIKFKERFLDIRRGFPVIVNMNGRGKKDRQLGSRI